MTVIPRVVHDGHPGRAHVVGEQVHHPSTLTLQLDHGHGQTLDP